MRVRRLDRRSLARWFWCGMLCGAIGAAMMMDRLPVLPG